MCEAPVKHLAPERGVLRDRRTLVGQRNVELGTGFGTGFNAPERAPPHLGGRKSPGRRNRSGTTACWCTTNALDCRPVTPEVAGSSPVAPVFCSLSSCKSACSVGCLGADDRRSLRHPAHIPHGKRRTKPGVAGK